MILYIIFLYFIVILFVVLFICFYISEKNLNAIKYSICIQCSKYLESQVQVQVQVPGSQVQVQVQVPGSQVQVQVLVCHGQVLFKYFFNCLSIK